MANWGHSPNSISVEILNIFNIYEDLTTIFINTTSNIKTYSKKVVIITIVGNYEIMYLSLSELRSNYEGESRIHVCALAKPLISPSCLPHFPTTIIIDSF